MHGCGAGVGNIWLTSRTWLGSAVPIAMVLLRLIPAVAKVAVARAHDQAIGRDAFSTGAEDAAA